MIYFYIFWTLQSNKALDLSCAGSDKFFQTKVILDDEILSSQFKFLMYKIETWKCLNSIWKHLF